MFWDNFVRLCYSMGKSPNAVASEIGLKSTGTVTGWKNGAIPRPSVIQKLASYFNVPVEYLTETENSPSEDRELEEYREHLRTRPEMRLLFHTFKDSTKEEIEAIVAAWEAMHRKE